MIKHSLFADQEREAKLNELGDTLRMLEQHVDFTAQAAVVDAAAPQPSRERGGRRFVGPRNRQLSDIEARWTRKHGKSYFGYKLSANVDKRYKLIRNIKISTASAHDTLHL
jgi:IS5 family transposase